MRHASQSAGLRPKYAPKLPAAMAEMQAPKFIKLVISCWTVDCSRSSVFEFPVQNSQPVTLTSIPYANGLVGSSYPKTIKKPGIACKPPTAAVSMPYCMLAIATAEHISRHLRFAQSVDLFDKDIVDNNSRSFAAQEQLRSAMLLTQTTSLDIRRKL